MKKLFILTALVEWNTEVKKNLELSLESVKSQTNGNFKYVLVLSEEVALKSQSKIDSVCKKAGVKNTNLVGTGNSVALINFAMANLEADFVGLLNVGDSLNSSYVNTILAYIEEHTDVDMFVPINVMKTKEDTIEGIRNEMLWAYGHNGYFEFEQVKKDSPAMHLFNGCVFRTKVHQSIGGFKPSIEYFNMYEFVMRLLHKGKQAFVIPKLLYVHSLLDDPYTQLSISEKQFWYNLGKREYMFDFDREVVFEA